MTELTESNTWVVNQDVISQIQTQIRDFLSRNPLWGIRPRWRHAQQKLNTLMTCAIELPVWPNVFAAQVKGRYT